MDLLELVDQLEEAVLAGRQARFGGGWSVDRERLLELVDRMRAAVPAEVEGARAVLRDRDQVIAGAEESAEVLLIKARQEAEHQVNAHDLVLTAQRRASVLVEEARERSREITETARAESAAMRGEATTQAVEQALEADRYSRDMLRRLDGQLTAIQSSVRAGIETLDEKVQREEEMQTVDLRDAEIKQQHAGE